MNAITNTGAPRVAPDRELIIAARQASGLKLGTLARRAAEQLGEPTAAEAHRVRLHRFEAGDVATIPAPLADAVAEILGTQLRGWRDHDEGARLAARLGTDADRAAVRSSLLGIERAIRRREARLEVARRELAEGEAELDSLHSEAARLRAALAA